MTLIGWAQIALVLACVVAAAVPLGRFIAGVAAGERGFLHPVLGPVERAIYAAAGVDPARGQGWRAYTLAMLAFNAAGLRAALRHPAAAGRAALQPAGLRRHDALTSPSTRRSASSPTPTGRPIRARPRPPTSARWPGSTVQNFVSAATGIALALALSRAFAAGGLQGSRQLLGRPRRASRSTCCCRSRSLVGLAFVAHGHAADPRRLCRGGDAGRRASRPSRSARSPSRWPSSTSAPMAAASSA